MTIPTIVAELMLLNWQVTASGGAKIVFAISEEELEPFRALTRKEGNKPGQRLQAAIAVIQEDEPGTPAAEIESRGIGPLCLLAVRWCRDPRFHEFLLAVTKPGQERLTGNATSKEEHAAIMVKRICKIESRKELDTNDEAAVIFERRIRRPFMEIIRDQRTDVEA